MTVLTVVWCLAALAGAASALAAALIPSARPPLLLAAYACWLVAGILGILSVGIIFLAAAFACLTFAVRTASP